MNWHLITLDEVHAMQKQRKSKEFHILMKYSYLTHQYIDNEYLNTIKWNKQTREDIIYTFINDDVVEDNDIFISHNIIECYDSYVNKLNMVDYLSKIFL